MNTSRFKVNARVLKDIAIISMLIDHFAAAVIWRAIIEPAIPIRLNSPMYTLYIIYRVMRGIGRLAFPIFCFFLVEGFIHTSSRPKYALRLFIFALISEIPFDLGFYGRLVYNDHQNVFFELLSGLLAMWCCELIGSKLRETSMPKELIPVFEIIPCIGIAYVTYLLKFDYDAYGIITILVLYFFRPNPLLQKVLGALSSAWEWPAMFSYILLWFYNGERGKQIKYFFYIFYPAHFMILWIITLLILN